MIKNLGLLFLVLGLVGCNYSRVKGLDNNDLGDLSVCAPTDFETVFKNVIQPRCVNCHRPERAEKGVLLNTFAAVEANIVRIQEQVDSNNMPDGMPLPRGEKKFLLGWIVQGHQKTINGVPAQNCDDNRSTVDLGPHELGPNYDAIFKFVLDKKCVSCHNPNPKDKDSNGLPIADFSTYESMMSRKEFFEGATPADSRMIKALTSDDIFTMMPLFGNQLPAEEIEVVVEWIGAGLPRVEGGAPGFSKEELGQKDQASQPPPSQELPPIVLPEIPPLVPVPPPTTPPGAEKPQCDELVDFKTVDAQVLKPVCLNCHGLFAMPAFDSFADVKTHIVKIQAMVSLGVMPPPPKNGKPGVILSDCRKKILLDWIQQGAPETLNKDLCVTTKGEQNESSTDNFTQLSSIRTCSE